jgi:hypothetical protein
VDRQTYMAKLTVIFDNTVNMPETGFREIVWECACLIHVVQNRASVMFL